VQYPHQGPARGSDLGAMFQRELAQYRLALWRQADADPAPVIFRAVAPDQPTLRQPVDHSHHAVMLKLQTLGQFPDGRLTGMRFDG